MNLIDDFYLSLMGEKGGSCVGTGNGTVTGEFYGIYFPTDGSISQVGINLTNSQNLTGRNFGAGTMIPGVVSSITMTSGIVILLNK